MVVPVGSAPASILGSVPHAPPCLRLRAGERRTRYQGNSGLAWPSIDTVHRALYRTVTHTVQRFLALIPIPMREAEFSSPRLPLACVYIHGVPMVELRLHIGERRTGYQSCSNMVRHTELSPTGSEISGADRQSEIVAAIIGPITHLFAQRRKGSMVSRARAWAYVCQGEARQSTS